MELLRNYQVAKELGLIDGPPGKYEYDQEKLRNRIMDAYRARFNIEPSRTDETSRPSSPSRRKTTGLTSSRTVTATATDIPATSEQLQEFREIISGLEDRVNDLEDRNAALREKYDLSSKEHHELQLKYNSLLEERNRLGDQLARMKEMVASESSATRILQRVSDVSPSAQSHDLKLEIYKQQIVMLTEELSKLKSRTSI